MSTELEVKVKITKDIFIQDGFLFAEIVFSLPADDDFTLINPLISYQHKLLGKFLHPDEGQEWYDSDTNKKCFRLYRNSQRFNLELSSVTQAIKWLDDNAREGLETLNLVFNRFLEVNRHVNNVMRELGELEVSLPLTAF